MSLDDVKLHLVETFSDAEALMTWMGTADASGVLAIDTETTGLIHGRDKVRLTQVGGLVHGWAIPQHRWSGLVADIVKKYTGHLIMHNATFDQRMLAADGIVIEPTRIHDTRPMAHILEPNMANGLKPQAARHVDALAAGAQSVLDSAVGKAGGWTWATIPLDYGPYWQYAALDTVLTRHLFDHHYPLVMADAPDAYQLEMDAMWVIANMETYGVPIDVAHSQKYLDEFTRSVDELGKWVKDTYGVSAGSNTAIIDVLRREGFDNPVYWTKLTASGAPSLDKDALSGIDHPLAKTVLHRRRLQKLASTYLTHFVNEVDSNDIIHPSINTLGARTSRMSMSNPNFQNLPTKSESNPAAETVRNGVASRYRNDGGRLVMCDFDQIEMRLYAHMSQDPGLIAAFNSPEDFFVGLARAIFNDDTIDKKDPRRRITKSVNYAEIYGAGVAKLALTAGIPEEQVRVVKARFDQLYPGGGAFKKKVEQIAWQRQREEGVGYVRSPFTRRRHVADRDKIYPLVNYRIQGTAAELFKMKLIECDKAGLGPFMVVPVHDEIVLDVPAENIEDVVHTLQKIMNDTEICSVPISASVSWGERWGAKIDWEETVAQ